MFPGEATAMPARLRPQDYVPHAEDVTSPGFTDNDTFYECSECHKVWQGPRLPGVLHKYVRCGDCRSDGPHRH